MNANTTISFRILISIASFLSGALAGGDIYRYVIEVPAWRKLDISNWVEFSRHADLGVGLILFPFEAIGAALLLATASAIRAVRIVDGDQSTHDMKSMSG